MADLLHEIVIDAKADEVTQALTTQDGLRSWWTADSTAEPTVGSTAEFGFDNRQIVFRMKVEQIDPGQKVVWFCIGGPDQWVGTRVTWFVNEENGTTRLRFAHSDWKSIDGVYAICNTTWGHLMVVLKQYLEGENPGPYFDG